MAHLRADVLSGAPVVKENETVADWFGWWTTTVLPRSVKPDTVDNYRRILDYYVFPSIGPVLLAQLAPEHVGQMMADLEGRGLSPRTVSLARTVLRRGLRQAEAYGKVRRNVAALVDPPKQASAKIDDALSADGAARVLETVRGDRLEALAVLVLMVGLRKGEALALRWADIDFEAGTLSVAQSKTASGVRTIAMPETLTRALWAHFERQQAEVDAQPHWEDPGLVFATTIGTPLDGRNVLRWWHALTMAAGVGRRRFHASRHTAATLMLNAGVPLEVVSKTLGHAGLSITADVYAKVRPDLQRTAAETMDELLGG